MTKAYNFGLQDGRQAATEFDPREHLAQRFHADPPDPPSADLDSCFSRTDLANVLGIDVSMVRFRTLGYSKALKDYDAGYKAGLLEDIQYPIVAPENTPVPERTP